MHININCSKVPVNSCWLSTRWKGWQLTAWWSGSLKFPKYFQVITIAMYWNYEYKYIIIYSQTILLYSLWTINSKVPVNSHPVIKLPASAVLTEITGAKLMTFRSRENCVKTMKRMKRLHRERCQDKYNFCDRVCQKLWNLVYELCKILCIYM